MAPGVVSSALSILLTLLEFILLSRVLAGAGLVSDVVYISQLSCETRSVNICGVRESEREHLVTNPNIPSRFHHKYTLSLSWSSYIPCRFYLRKYTPGFDAIFIRLIVAVARRSDLSGLVLDILPSHQSSGGRVHRRTRHLG